MADSTHIKIHDSTGINLIRHAPASPADSVPDSAFFLTIGLSKDVYYFWGHVDRERSLKWVKHGFILNKNFQFEKLTGRSIVEPKHQFNIDQRTFSEIEQQLPMSFFQLQLKHGPF